MGIYMGTHFKVARPFGVKPKNKAVRAPAQSGQYCYLCEVWVAPIFQHFQSRTYWFSKIAVENIKISEELQALIAPAILPRSFLSLQILQFLRTFRAQVPVRSPERRSPGGLYYLSYLDRDMLLGRAVGGGGVFVFTRSQPLT